MHIHATNWESRVLDLRDLARELDRLRDQSHDEDIELDTDDLARLHALRELERDLCGQPVGGGLHDYAEDASEMVPADAFAEYAQQVAEDIGAIDRNDQWPHTCIDWQLAARELAHDYTRVRFGGEDYYIRAA